MKVIGIHKETKEKVWLDINHRWGSAYHNCLVCEYGKEVEPKMFGIGENQFSIDPNDYDWAVGSIDVENKVHLCDSCKKSYPSCSMDCEAKNIIFGTGVGNDNVIACSEYQSINVKEKINNTKKTCKWKTKNYPMTAYWETDCGKFLTESILKEEKEGMKYCPYCGNLIEFIEEGEA